MNIFRSTTKLALIALAMSASVGAWAVPLTNPIVTGTHIVWGVVAPNTLAPVSSTPASIATALTGNAADPTGNVELSKFGGPVTTLSGDIAGNPIVLSSLVLSDWTVGGNALATQYIQDAAMAAFGAPLNAVQFATALTNFYNLNVGGHKPWQLVSDPNISYVYGDSSSVYIGLAGLLDASPFLTAISGIPLPSGKQASEVVKVTYNGITDYRYGFSATPSGYHTTAFPLDQSYTGNYQVPLPGILWLFGAGLAGLLASRRRPLLVT
ncbi:MAG: NF038130 family PEP-CTERM protein [Gammaproteobacteria bacterium]